jgi:hypothetical protein
MKQKIIDKTKLLRATIIMLVFFFSFYKDAFAQTGSNDFVLLDQESNVGQSFTSLYDGLNRLGITLSSETPVEGELILRLFENNSERKLITEQSYFLEVGSARYISLEFEPQSNSTLKNYYVDLSWSGPGQLQVGTAGSESYLEGSLYQNDTPVMAQLAFDLGYSKGLMLFGLLETFALWTWRLSLTALILLLPGWAIMARLWSKWGNYDLLTKIALASVVSYSLYPILFLLTDFLGIHPGELFFVWAVMATSILLLLIPSLKKSNPARLNRSTLISRLKEVRTTTFTNENLVFLMVVLVLIFTKLWSIRAVTFPLWGDSYQHTVITQLMVDNGGLFSSWQPYTPYETLTVHFGFHSISTVFAWISGVNASQSVLWIGQISNAMAALSLYPIALLISKGRKTAGIPAIVFAGLLFRYPNYYVNWGRYAQLSGLVILPVIGFMLIETLFHSEAKWKDNLIISAMISSLAICYYRMPFYLSLWLPLIIGELIIWSRSPERRWHNLLLTIVSVAAGMVFFLIPLYLRIRGGLLAESVAVSSNSSFSPVLSNILNDLKGIKYYYAPGYLVLSGLSILLSFIKKNWQVTTILLGLLMLYFFRLGAVIDLPFANFLDGFSIQIMAYIGFSLILGYLFGELLANLEVVNFRIVPILLLGVALLSAWSAKNVLDKTKHEMVTWADERAFEWIKTNTELDSLFLVNGFAIYDDTSVVGSDGGWWISLLTNRQNTMPPQYALLNEKPQQPDYSKWVVDVVLTLEGTSPDSPKGFSRLCDWGIDYIYIGQRQGLVNDAEPLLTWQEWDESIQFEKVYIQDHVRIYQLNRSLCSTSAQISYESNQK